MPRMCMRSNKEGEPQTEDGAAKKGDEAWDQRVLAAPRADSKQESIKAMIKRMTSALNKEFAQFKENMKAAATKVTHATKNTADQDSR